ncbi:NAD(P)-binding protein [Streptomyces sp. TRM 70361]|uniref:NAD(P)/FAD-dependent oxidoreductase n=1 Tax=Streptomyces sp. TRM 70361 TaxID=3116553 RepID=UPI002E7C1F52|nr:NAD(P)-binding protein [Streptomyces sp. TRM 70361]MEE1938396.1 NAD(P)-binding protein [Streptomyces sp. TRM 70361]
MAARRPGAGDSAPALPHAVVIGAGIAGLTAARALADTCDRVTVLDRDVLPAVPAPRRGTPQSRHLHVLLARGAQALDELFPGFLAELAEAGAVRADTQGDAHWYLDGHRVRRAPSGLMSYGVSRPLLEHRVRERVADLGNVTLLPSTEVLGPVTTPDRARITGVRTRPRTGGTDAGLVVDASGRGSRALHRLAELGHPLPAKTEVRADIVYVTRHFRREPHHLDGRKAAAIVGCPGQPRSGAVITVEGDRFAVVLRVVHMVEPPTALPAPGRMLRALRAARRAAAPGTAGG